MTTPRRVALVSDWCLPRQGGIETHILQLAQRLRSRGNDATIITTFPGPDMVDGVPVDRIAGPRLPVAPVSLSPFLVGTLRQRLQAGGYDMVHVHCSIVAPLCFAALPAARSLGLPSVVTFHSVMRAMPRFLALSDRFLGWTDPSVKLTAVSGLVAGQVASGFRDVSVAVLPNGFDPQVWRAARDASEQGKILRVVSALRLQPRKRPLELIDIFARGRKLVRDRGLDMSLTIAGDGPLRPALERRIARLGLGDSVTLLGWQAPEALRALYAQSDLFVMPSIREAFCIAALEARAAGLPVVAMAASGIADFIRDRESGILAQDDDAMALSIAELATDARLRQRLASTDDRLERYGWEALVDEHIALYQSSLDRAAARR